MKTFSIFFVLINLFFCQLKAQTTERHQFDHILIFCSDQSLENELNKLFSPAEKLTTIHQNQGTKGKYYLFFNTFIELLYIEDSAKILANHDRFGSAYLHRWKKQSASQFGFGLNFSQWPNDLDSSKFHKYNSEDSPEDEFYLMSKSNLFINQPLLYWSMPKRAYKRHDNLESVKANSDPKIVNDLVAYLSHPSGIKQLTKIILQTKEDTIGENFKILSSSNLIEIKSAERNSLTLIFDHHEQEKSMYFKGEIELMIHF